MPFAGFKDFAACVAAQRKKGKSKDSANKICGYLQNKAEGRELSEEEYTKLLFECWAEEILNRNRED